MGVVRVYIKPFASFDSQLVEYIDFLGESTFKLIKKGVYADDWIDVTEDISDNQLSQVSLSLDYGDYDVGVFRFNEMQLSLNNKNNRYGNADAFGSIFRYKRTNSLIKITYDVQPLKPICGSVPCGAIKTFEEEFILFEGVLNDDTYTEDIDSVTARFKILGFDSLYSKTLNYAVLAGGAGPSHRIDDILKNNEAVRTGPLPILSDPTLDLLIYDLANINPAYPDFSVAYPDDDMYPFQGWLWDSGAYKNDSENLNDALKANNSVLLIQDRTYIVRDRSPNQADPVFTFYGQQASGPENIIELNNIKNGLNRSFNQWAFRTPADYSVEDETLVQTYGRRSKILEYDMTAVDDEAAYDYLQYMLSEWGEPKVELEVETPMTPKSVDLKILDMVNIDLPSVTYTEDEDSVYGLAVYGESTYPEEAFSFTVDASRRFKIMGIDYDLSKQTIKFLLREI